MLDVLHNALNLKISINLLSKIQNNHPLININLIKQKNIQDSILNQFFK